MRGHPETVGSPAHIRRILIPLDRSHGSREAVEAGLVLAAAEGAAVTFLHFLSHPAPPDAEFDESLRDAAALAEERGVAWNVDFMSSDFASVVLLYAEAIAADLTVVGAGERWSRVAWHAGPITRALVRRKARPILVAPRSHPGGRWLGFS